MPRYATWGWIEMSGHPHVEYMMQKFVLVWAKLAKMHNISLTIRKMHFTSQNPQLEAFIANADNFS